MPRHEEIEGIAIHRYKLPNEAEGAVGYLLEYGVAMFMTLLRRRPALGPLGDVAQLDGVPRHAQRPDLRVGDVRAARLPLVADRFRPYLRASSILVATVAVVGIVARIAGWTWPLQLISGYPALKFASAVGEFVCA